MAKSAYRETKDRRQKLDKTPVKIAVQQGNRSSSSRNIRPIKTLGLMCVGWPSLPRQRFPNRFPPKKVVVPNLCTALLANAGSFIEHLCGPGLSSYGKGLAKGLGWPR